MDKRTKIFISSIIISVFGFCLLIFLGAIKVIRNTNTVINQISTLQAAKNHIIYFDEVLTMSARMAAVTGDRAWIKRYHEYIPKLDKAISTALNYAPNRDLLTGAKETQKANDALVKMELKAFDLVEESKSSKAYKLLFSKEYEKQKKIYSSGMDLFNQHLNHLLQNILERAHQQSIFISLFFLLLTLSFVSLWWLIIRRFNLVQMQIKEKEQKELAQETELALLGEIAAGIGHDISNPLSIISGNLNLLKNNETQESNQKYIERMEMALKTVRSMTMNLLSLARNSEKDQLTSENLFEIVNEAILFSEKRLQKSKLNAKNNIQIVFDKKFEIVCHRQKLIQVLINLLHNAIDAIQGASSPWIRFDAELHKENYKICIVDSGNGIQKDIAHKIFNSQYTTKERGKGTGIGLSLSKKMIQSMGGDIYLDTKSINTKFVIQLPKTLVSYSN
ncbi:MAG: HAMP domain-containing histidine kinase [Bdellovibrionales bacterium]|nr:HAMP domain-containing histidine kinase [Bdellovibrionales bacterium]